MEHRKQALLHSPFNLISVFRLILQNERAVLDPQINGIGDVGDSLLEDLSSTRRENKR
jgi:hypothetical protein